MIRRTQKVVLDGLWSSLGVVCGVSATEETEHRDDSLITTRLRITAVSDTHSTPASAYQCAYRLRAQRCGNQQDTFT